MFEVMEIGKGKMLVDGELFGVRNFEEDRGEWEKFYNCVWSRRSNVKRDEGVESERYARVEKLWEKVRVLGIEKGWMKEKGVKGKGLKWAWDIDLSNRELVKDEDLECKGSLYNCWYSLMSKEKDERKKEVMKMRLDELKEERRKRRGEKKVRKVRKEELKLLM